MAFAADCTTNGFKQLVTSGQSPIYPVEPMCYKQINEQFLVNPPPTNTFPNKFVVVNSCIEFQDTKATNGGWFLQQIMNSHIESNTLTALKQFFGQVVYLTENQLLYNNLGNFQRNRGGSQNIIPACKQKDNRDARITYWYNEKRALSKSILMLPCPTTTPRGLPRH